MWFLWRHKGFVSVLRTNEDRALVTGSMPLVVVSSGRSARLCGRIFSDGGHLNALYPVQYIRGDISGQHQTHKCIFPMPLIEKLKSYLCCPTNTIMAWLDIIY